MATYTSLCSTMSRMLRSAASKSYYQSRSSTRNASAGKKVMDSKDHHETHKNTRSKRTFAFTNYDCIGFDLDNTLCMYKVGTAVKLEYELMARYMVEVKKYPGVYLLKPMEENVDFLLKGLFLDLYKGNILRIASNGQIIHASHGTHHLTKEELMNYYGKQCRWNVVDEYTKDPLCAWNGPLSKEIRTLLDYFDMPAGLVFARAVDTLDNMASKRLNKYYIWPDLLDALLLMYQRENFRENVGGYFPALKSNPGLYIQKCSDNLIKWMKTLKSKKKVLFLLTGSNCDFASMTAEACLGKDWRELFDIVVCFAKKPGFFTQNRPFYEIEEGCREGSPVPADDLKCGQMYLQGNYKDLYTFLKRHSYSPNPKILYVGDNLIQDVYTPATYVNCHTVAVVEELQAEGRIENMRDHEHRDTLVSKYWGSYFHHKNRVSFWKNLIDKYAQACVPSMEFVATRSVDHHY